MAAKKKGSGGGTKVAAVVGIALALGGAHKAHHGHGGGIFAHFTSARTASASQAISYAWRQVGKSYCWGGTGPSCYDCSGLVQQAYGGSTPRTTFKQWAQLPHVPASQVHPGDLVFAPGSDGTQASPGHVGIVISRDRVIQAYATGTPIEVSSLAAFAAGAGGIVGYARPGGA
jgi:cell wall-associated NlpC family hydrolase